MDVEDNMIPVTGASAMKSGNTLTANSIPAHATDEELVDDNETTITLTVHEKGAGAMDDTVSSTTTDQTPHADKVPQTLVEIALAADAWKSKGKPTSGRGDMVVVLDTKDLAKTIVLDSSVLARQVPRFDTMHHLHDVDTKELEPTTSGARHLFVLESCAHAEGMPTLERKTLNTEAPPVPVDAASVNGDEVADANSGVTIEVKNEPVDDGQRIEQSQTPPQGGPINWVKAYEIFFRTVGTISMSARSVGLSNSAKAALPLLQGVLVISERYECVPDFWLRIQVTVKRLDLESEAVPSNRRCASAVAGSSHQARE